jgi:hypothetical protein
MPREIFPSSYECDCGHQSHFFVNTIIEAKQMSLKKQLHLGDSEVDEHIIVFRDGRMVDILCPRQKGKSRGAESPGPSGARTAGGQRSKRRSAPKYTDKQGQYLAFINLYTKLHRRPPAEMDIRDYFRVSPPSVHQMIVTLERRGLIERTPGQPRSIRIVLAPDELPNLEPIL